MRRIRKYNRLIAHTSDWPKYVFDKFIKSPEIYLEINNKVKAIIPRNPIRAIFKEIFMEDMYDYRFLLNVLPQNPVIVDIGANVGYFDLLIFSYFEEPKIYAFEPSPSNYNLISRHKEINSLQGLFVFKKAVSDKTGTIRFYFDESNEHSAIGSVYDSFDPLNTSMINVESITLDDFLLEQQIDHVDLLKVDCEGAEYDILYHSLPSLREKVSTLVVESHDLGGENKSRKDLLHFLQKLKYHTTSKDGMIWAYS